MAIRFVIITEDLVSDDDYILSPYTKGMVGVNRNYEFIRFSEAKQRWVPVTPTYHKRGSRGGINSPSIQMRHQGKNLRLSVPRIIYDVFGFKKLDPRRKVMHKDGIVTNNHISNLRLGPRE